MGHSFINTAMPKPVVRVNGFVTEVHTVAENVSFTFAVGHNGEVRQTGRYGWGAVYVSPPTYGQMMRQVYGIAAENKHVKEREAK